MLTCICSRPHLPRLGIFRMTFFVWIRTTFGSMARPSHPSPDSQLEFVLHAVSRSLARTYNAQFHELGLSQSQAGVLLQVDWADARTQTELARKLGIQKAAAGALIIDLEE